MTKKKNKSISSECEILPHQWRTRRHQNSSFFRSLSKQKRAGESVHQQRQKSANPPTALYGYVVYHQQKDKTVERGARQRAILILTRRPMFYAMNTLGRNLIAPLFTDLLKFSVDKQNNFNSSSSGAKEKETVEEAPMIPSLSPDQCAQRVGADTCSPLQPEITINNEEQGDTMPVFTLCSSIASTPTPTAVESSQVRTDGEQQCMGSDIGAGASSATLTASASDTTGEATATVESSAGSALQDNATVIRQESDIMASVINMLYGALTEAVMKSHECEKESSAAEEGNVGNAHGIATSSSQEVAPISGQVTPVNTSLLNKPGPFLCRCTDLNLEEFYRKHNKAVDESGNTKLESMMLACGLESAKSSSFGVDLLGEMIAAEENSVSSPCPGQHLEQCRSVSFAPPLKNATSPRKPISPTIQNKKMERTDQYAKQAKRKRAVSCTISLLLPRPQASLLDQLSYGASLRDIFKLFQKEICWIHASVLSLTPVVFVGTTAQQVSDAVLSTVHLVRGLPSLSPAQFVPYATIELMDKVIATLTTKVKNKNAAAVSTNPDNEPKFLVLGTTNAFITHRSFAGILKVNLADREIHLPKGEYKLRIPDRYEAFFHSLSQRVAAVSSADTVPLDPHYTNELELRAELALFNANLTKTYRENRGLMYSVLSHRTNIFEKLRVTMTIEKAGREDTGDFVLVDDNESAKTSPRGETTLDTNAPGEPNETSTQVSEIDKKKDVTKLLKQRMGCMEQDDVNELFATDARSLIPAAQRYARNSMRNIHVLERLSQWHATLTTVLSKIAQGSNEQHRMVFEQLFFSKFNVASGAEKDENSMVDWSRLVSDDCIAGNSE